MFLRRNQPSTRVCRQQNTPTARDAPPLPLCRLHGFRWAAHDDDCRGDLPRAGLLLSTESQSWDAVPEYSSTWKSVHSVIPSSGRFPLEICNKQRPPHMFGQRATTWLKRHGVRAVGVLEYSMMRISPSYKKLISKQSLVVYKGDRSR
jgi:hypothetical protein